MTIFNFLKIFSNPTPGNLSKESKDTNLKRYCIPVVSAALFAIARVQKQPACRSVDAWTKKNVIHTPTHTMDNYLAIKKKEKLAIWGTMDGPYRHCAKENK